MCLLVDHEARPNLINVSRYNIISGAKRGFTKATFNPAAPLNVKFMGEFGADEGGLTREFITLTCSNIQKSIIFQGHEDARSLAYNISGMYFTLKKHTLFFLLSMLCRLGQTKTGSNAWPF